MGNFSAKNGDYCYGTDIFGDKGWHCVETLNGHDRITAAKVALVVEEEIEWS